MSRIIVSLFVALLFALVFKDAHAQTCTPDNSRNIRLGINLAAGGAWSSMWCRPADRYGRWVNRIDVIRPAAMSPAQLGDLSLAMSEGRWTDARAFITSPATVEPNLSVWSPSAAAILASEPPGPWVVAGPNGDRPVYFLNNGLVGDQTGQRAVRGTRCLCHIQRVGNYCAIEGLPQGRGAFCSEVP